MLRLPRGAKGATGRDATTAVAWRHAVQGPLPPPQLAQVTPLNAAAPCVIW